MDEIDYHKVGEEFEHNGRKFVPIDVCDLCDLKDVCNSYAMNCNYDEREDYRSVFYKEVNKRESMGALLLQVLSILLLTVFGAVIVSLILQGEYLIGLLLTLCVMFVVTDAWVNGKKNK